MGARSTLVGRAYLYGPMAGGREGVDRMIDILSEQIVRTMKLLQVTCIEELEPRHDTQLTRFAGLRPRGVGERARRAGATEEQLVEAALVAMPFAGVASWLPAAQGVIDSRDVAG